MNLFNLFPIPIGMFQCNQHALINDCKKLIVDLEQLPNEGNTKSEKIDVLELELLQPLRAWVSQCLEQFFREVYGAGQSVDLHIVQSWANYSDPGQFHHAHRHQNSLVSGVFYVQCNESDKIQFLRDGYQQLQLKPDTWNLYNANSWWLPVNEGLLLLFPSSTIHEVPRVDGNQTRISIAFNTFPSGIMGSRDTLTRLQLPFPITA